MQKPRQNRNPDALEKQSYIRLLTIIWQVCQKMDFLYFNKGSTTVNMVRIIIFFLSILPLTVFCQGYINKSKKQVRRGLEKEVIKNDSLRILLEETDSTLIFSIKDSKVLPADFIYSFDESGKCNIEKKVAYCDSCFNKFLQASLNCKICKWKKLTEYLYISGYFNKMLLEISRNNDHSFLIRKMKWTRKVYKTLLTSK